MAENIKITATVRKTENMGNQLARVNLVLNDSVVIKSIRVMNNQKTNVPFVSMPRHSYEKDGEKKWVDDIYPITKETRDNLIKVVMDAYNEEKEATSTDEVIANNFVAKAYKMNNGGDWLANVQLTINDAIVVKGIQIRNNKNTGVPFVSMPSHPEKHGDKEEYVEDVHAITKEARDEILKVIMDAYNEAE